METELRKPNVDAFALAALIDRALGSQIPISFERVAEGVSTQVYRLTRGSEVFYLRVAEEETDRLTVDAEALRQLRRLGVHVPDVVYVEPFNAALGRSVMITTEVRGQSLEHAPSLEAARAVARRAGEELALVNQVEVQGFGFVRRDEMSWPLVAEFSDYADFVSSYLADPWPGALSSLFDPSDLSALETLVEAERSRTLGSGQLAHGDFDVTQIFHVGGHYAGLIDFGEMRGAEPLFDLGHFLLHDCETYPEPLIGHLISGYQEISPLPADFTLGILQSGILLGLRQLCRWMARYPSPTGASIRRALRLKEMLGQVP